MILGIDPGVHGALALLDEKTLDPIAAWPMPIITTRKKIGGGRRVKGFRKTSVTTAEKFSTKNRLDLATLYEKFQMVRMFGASHAVIEDVMGWGHQKGSSNFGFAIGVVHMGCAAIGLPAHTLTPTGWQAPLGLGADKEANARWADKQWPNKRHLWRTDRGAVHVDRAEACLIAYSFALMKQGRGK